MKNETIEKFWENLARAVVARNLSDVLFYASRILAKDPDELPVIEA